MGLLDIFRRTPPLNDFKFFDSVWNENKNGGTVRLGTYDELEETFSALARCAWFTKDIGVLYSHTMEGDILEILGRHIYLMDHKGSSAHQVGSPDDVHYLIPPKHSFGYSIETGKNGYSLETLEMLKTRLEVIKQYGKVIAAKECHIGRSEHYGSIHLD